MAVEENVARKWGPTRDDSEINRICMLDALLPSLTKPGICPNLAHNFEPILEKIFNADERQATPEFFRTLTGWPYLSGAIMSKIFNIFKKFMK